MKKFMAILLATMLVIGLMPTAFAANANEGSVVVNAIDNTSYTMGDVTLKAGASSSDTDGVSVSENTFTFTDTDGQSKTYGYTFVRDFSPAIPSRLEVKQTISFTNPGVSVFRPTAKGKNADKTANTDPFGSTGFWVMQNGLFFDKETECVANTEYIFSTSFNTDANVMTWNVRNDALGVNITKSHVYNSEDVILANIWYLTWLFHASEKDSAMDIKDFTVSKYEPIVFTSVENGDIVNSASATLSAYVHNPADGVKFILDGQELAATAGQGNVYSASVEGLANGLHRFTVIAGVESKTITFTSAHVAASSYVDIMTTAKDNIVSPMVVENCVGSDGIADSGLQLSGSKGGLHLRHGSLTYNINRSLWFEADIRRIGNAGFKIYGSTAPSKNNPELTGGIIIQRGSPEGTICGTSSQIAQNDEQWHNLRIIQQLKNENSEYLVYLDGELIKRETLASWVGSTQTALSISRFELLDSSSPLQIDNAKMGEIVSPVFISAAYKTDAAAAEFTAATDGVISGISKVIKITQLNNPSLEGVAVTVNGIAATAVIDSADANSLIITPADGSINANEDVVVKVGNYVTTLKANGDMLDNIGAVKAEFVGSGASAKITIAKATVGVSALDKVTLIVASYDGNKLKAIDLRQITLESGSKEYTATIENLNGGTKVRAMLWGGLSALSPISFDEATVSEN